MTTAELKSKLASTGFKSNVYSIDGSPLPAYEGLILERSGERWKIDHFERGMRRELESFANESEACQRMYELLQEHFQ
jgi:hypothetical protein